MQQALLHRRIRIEDIEARRQKDQAAACAACNKGCKQPMPDCRGGFGLRDVASSALRLLTLSWPGMTAMALMAFAYMSTVS